MFARITEQISNAVTDHTLASLSVPLQRVIAGTACDVLAARAATGVNAHLSGPIPATLGKRPVWSAPDQ